MRHTMLLPLALVCAPAFAQQAEIVVSGAGLPAGAGDAAYDVVTIDRNTLTRSASGRLEDILRDAAGFQQFRRSDARSAHPTSQGATLRGLGGNASTRALILLDGVPQVDPFGGWVSWAAYDPMRLGLVRVTRGGGSGAYGPGALAGTIELVSAGPTQLSPLWGGLAYGSRDSIDADVGLSGELGGGFATLSASYARGDGFTPIVKESRGLIDRPAPYQQYSVSARAVIPVGDDTELQASGLAFRDTRDRGTDFTDNRTTGADASLRLVGHGRWGWEAVAWLQTREFASQFSGNIDAARTTVSQSLDQYNVPATGLGTRLELRPPLGQGIELRLGTDARQTQGQTKELFAFSNGIPANRREAGGRTRVIGGFADVSLTPTDVLTITGGARIDGWWIENGLRRTSEVATGAVLTNPPLPDRSGWEPTAHAGLALRPTDAIVFRAAGYLGWRLPTLNELYRPFRVGSDTTLANEALAPERLKGVDAGIDYRLLSVLHLGATLFYNHLDDTIANVTLASTPASTTRQRQNLDAIRSKGVELTAGIEVAPWSLTAAYTYVDAVVRAPAGPFSLDGLRPAQTPRHHGSATLAWARSQGPSANVTLRYIGRQFEDDQNSRVLDGALTLDAAALIPLTHGLALDLRAENLTDARVEATVSSAGIIERATPRTLWVGLRYAR